MWLVSRLKQKHCTAVKFFSKSSYFIIGYFDPISVFCDIRNKSFSGWPKRHFGWNGHTAAQDVADSQLHDGVPAELRRIGRGVHGHWNRDAGGVCRQGVLQVRPELDHRSVHGAGVYDEGELSTRPRMLWFLHAPGPSLLGPRARTHEPTRLSWGTFQCFFLSRNIG